MYMEIAMINTLPPSLVETARQILESHLTEMAAPSKEIKGATFYHGTYDKRGGGDGKDIAQHIVTHGIQPPELSDKKETALKPVEGMTYTTHDIGYAQMYALGGNIAGSDFSNSNWKPKHSHGYIFSFKGNRLSDVQPDEDSVGELYYKYHRGDVVNGAKIPDYIDQLAKKHATAHTRNKAKEGEYAHWAKLGKSVIPHMTDEQKLEVISQHKSHVANRGNIIPDRAYRIPMDKIKHLKKDGSNFFDHAEELDIDELKKGNVVVRRKRKPL